MSDTDETEGGGADLDGDATGSESWSGVERVANESDAAIVVGFLQNHDIPARIHDKSFHELPTTDEDLSSIEVAVPTDRLEEARSVLERREAEYAAAPREDGSVLTDDGPRAIDPADPEGGEKGG